MKNRFEHFLANRSLIKILDLGCEGVSRPQAIAAHLKLGVKTIYNLRDRLQRAWRRFTKNTSS